MIATQVDAKDPSSRRPRDSAIIPKCVYNVTYALQMQAETGAGKGPLTEATFVKTNPLGASYDLVSLLLLYVRIGD